ncbi:MAG: hypothetical protein J6K04_13735 [Lachnospiraceae bacterium]|nr:hypothetical protein [Lachnospiraceae bacterium]
MGNQITFKQYRTIDILILVALTIIFEAITTMATAKWFVLQPVALSIGLAMVCVAMMRWGWQAAFLAFASGFTFCILTGAVGEQFLIYCIGNIGALLAMVWFKVFGKEGIRRSIAKILLFSTTAYVGTAFGRWLVSLLFGEKLTAIVLYFTTDIMTLVFAFLVVVLFRKTDGMLEDQKTYLLRLDKEKKETQDEPVREEEY